mgnify:CR=1 FL=1
MRRESVMDARRYDKNADQLSQVFWHFTKLQKQFPQHGRPQIEQMLVSLQQCMQMNDELGLMHEKGLI